jgi:hypothetical protein
MTATVTAAAMGLSFNDADVAAIALCSLSPIRRPSGPGDRAGDQREVCFAVQGRLISFIRRCALRTSAQMEATVEVRVVVFDVVVFMQQSYLRS